MAEHQPTADQFSPPAPTAAVQKTMVRKSMLARRAGLVSCVTLGALLALLLAVAAPAPRLLAQEVEPAGVDAIDAHTVTIEATQDTTVRSGEELENQNFGSDPSLAVLSQSGLGFFFAQAWMQFDLTIFPQYTEIHTATLQLRQTASSANNMSVSVGAPEAPWQEMTLTWANRPPVVGTGIVFQPPVTSPANVAVDITPRVQLWVSSVPAANNGLALTTNLEFPGARTFASREDATPRARPQLAINYTLPPVRVCMEQNDTCPPASGAEIFNLTRNQIYTTDANGLISPADQERIALDDVLWARYAVETTNGATRYHTMPQPARVESAAFMQVNDGSEMRVIVTADAPLLLQDLDVSAQWHVQGDPAAAALLARRIIGASNFLYSFTDGQFALGTVNVYQNYEQWDDANIQLYANNTLRPRAIIGGIVPTDTVDFNPTFPITYTPGSVSIGSYWNRFGTPPNSDNVSGGVPFTEAQMQMDWSIALAHEFGHYLLYLFDTYTGIDGNSNVELTLLCTGTAMGDAYLPTNHGFIADDVQWKANCSETQAYDRHQGRTEWATIQGWYDWVVVPTAFVPGPDAPPAPVTTVNFITPTVPPGAAAAQIFDLEYQDGEASSGEARAFLLRADRVLEQGKPPKDSLQVELTGAELGDRLCVYDINDHAEGDETPRHQFGCETIVVNDSTLVMTKDPAWSPEIAITQISANQVRIVMTETVPGAAGDAVFVRLFPEHDTAMAPLALPRMGSAFTLDVTLAGPLESLYAQIFVSENPTAPLTRREVIVDRGTGGGGAFGPAKHYGDMMVVSSDGNAAFEQDGDVELLPGQSIAWQSMPGTPPLPFGQDIIGQSYRLDAFPSSLVEDGAVSIRFNDPDAAGVTAAGSAGGNDVALWFWDGAGWRELSTTVVTPAGATDGVLLASAASQGVGVYAVLVDDPTDGNRYLPLIAR